jgi:hypothetical protein
LGMAADALADAAAVAAGAAAEGVVATPAVDQMQQTRQEVRAATLLTRALSTNISAAHALHGMLH